MNMMLIPTLIVGKSDTYFHNNNLNTSKPIKYKSGIEFEK